MGLLCTEAASSLASQPDASVVDQDVDAPAQRPTCPPGQVPGGPPHCHRGRPVRNGTPARTQWPTESVTAPEDPATGFAFPDWEPVATGTPSDTRRPKHHMITLPFRHSAIPPFRHSGTRVSSVPRRPVRGTAAVRGPVSAVSASAAFQLCADGWGRCGVAGSLAQLASRHRACWEGVPGSAV